MENFHKESSFDRRLMAFMNHFEVNPMFDLNRRLDQGLWRTDDTELDRIYHDYVNLVQLDVAKPNFGTAEFWDRIMGPSTQEGAGIVIGDPGQFYQLQQMANVAVPHFHTEGRDFIISFIDPGLSNVVAPDLAAIFDHAIGQLLEGVAENDLAGMQIRHPALDKPITIPFMPRNRFSGKKVIEIIEAVMQSNKEFTYDEMEIHIIIISNPEGGGFRNKRCYNLNWKEWFTKHCGHGGCFIQIPKKIDNHCLARAIVVAKARVDNDPKWNTIRQERPGRKNVNTEQGMRATKLMADAGLAQHHGQCGIEEMKKIQHVLPEYQIKVFSKDHFNAIIFEGPEAPKVLHLYLYDNHFAVISSMQSFIERSYFCDKCNKGYNNATDHRCSNVCRCCYRSNCKFYEWVYCKDCNRYFVSMDCYERHKKERTLTTKKRKVQRTDSTCRSIQRCNNCQKMLFRSREEKKPHICGFIECRICRQQVKPEEHFCYMQPLKDSENDEIDITESDDEEEENELAEVKAEIKPRFIFYDFETMQTDVIKQNAYGDIFKHVPVCCVAQKVCEDCKYSDIECNECGPRTRIFKGKDTTKDFCEWLFSDQNKNCTVIAHNSKGFDSQFLLAYCQQNAILPKVILKGLEIMCMEVGTIRFIDSLNFLPMPLANMPKAFDMAELKKGYFPHLFTKWENWKYNGKTPDAYFYSAATMKPEARTAFHKWHQEHKGDNFNFQQELVDYCTSDVDILRRCCIKFRHDFMEQTDVDPFVTSLTIASACNKVFRKNFLRPNTIGLVPPQGYKTGENQSVIALKWLKWISHTTGKRIQHARNGGETKVAGFKVDGMTEDGEIYEFHGCFWHGCPKCFQHDKKGLGLSANRRLTISEAYTRTVDRTQKLKKAGYKVIEMWECSLHYELKRNPEMKDFFDTCKINESLNPREAFFGGRTNAIQLYYKCKEGEKIHYIDVCSLYPWVCKYARFPIGHPKLITENFEPITRESHPYEGIVKCIVQPPYRLLNPVLPYRSGGKLMFPLCRTCVENQEPSADCPHTKQERAITGSWVSHELYEAVRKGYTVEKIIEVWHYDQSEQYSPDGDEGLFTGYINEFLKMKQQADGWPQNVITDEEKDEYIQNYYDHEGILLEKEKIKKNPGLRALAKLMLNSFWGKFGQRSNMGTFEYFMDPEKYLATVFCDTKVIKSVQIISDTMMAVNWMLEDEFVDVMQHTNPVIAAYTTAFARLKLYSYIEMLGSRVFYFDTDSLIYISRPGDPEPETGSYLGQMTNELRDYGNGSYITEFCSGGPKNYGYKVHCTKDNSEKTCIKVRGFTLNYVNSTKVNYDNLKRLVHEFVQENIKSKIDVVGPRIERTKDRDVITSTSKKSYQIVYDKRVVYPDFSTRPYGYYKV